MGKGVSALERRVAPRTKINFPLKFRVLGTGDDTEKTANAVDISAVSVLFQTDEHLSPSTAVDALLLIPSLAQPVNVKGYINRIEWTERENRFYYSMKFKEIDEKDRRVLAQYIDLIDIERLMSVAVEKNASDLHLISDSPPVVRVEGQLLSMKLPPIAAKDLQQMLLNMMSVKQRDSFEENLELDFSYSTPDKVRFRVNVHVDRGKISAAFRLIPNKIKKIEELKLPPVVHEFARKSKGLVVVSGPTGSGKTTTLAAIIDEINRNRNCMIVSIEDPIEYMHDSIQSIIKQREVGSDTHSFHNALKHVLRQDPDVILIGEIRDLESVGIAITAAETGHLVLTTLHTSNTAEAINRILDVYPSSQQRQVRSQLAGCLEGVISQNLLPRIDGWGRVLATEVLVATSAVRNVIREGKLEQLSTYLESGAKYGMHTMDNSLAELMSKNLIGEDMARGFAKDQRQLLSPKVAMR